MVYSILVFGYLLGKYLFKIFKNLRLDLFFGFDRCYYKFNFVEVVKVYVDIVY